MNIFLYYYTHTVYSFPVTRRDQTIDRRAYKNMIVALRSCSCIIILLLLYNEGTSGNGSGDISVRAVSIAVKTEFIKYRR